MIRVQWFSNKNSWRNLWGLLGNNVSDEVNAFMERHGARGTNGINVGPTGVYITYEDGVFTPANERDVLNKQYLDNMNAWTSQNITMRSLLGRKKETEERLETIETKLTELTDELKEEGDKYKENKPQIDELRAEKDYLNNVIMKNIASQFPQVKSDMDRLHYENEEITRMLREIR